MRIRADARPGPCGQAMEKDVRALRSPSRLQAFESAGAVRHRSDGVDDERVSPPGSTFLARPMGERPVKTDAGRTRQRCPLSSDGRRPGQAVGYRRGRGLCHHGYPGGGPQSCSAERLRDSPVSPVVNFAAELRSDAQRSRKTRSSKPCTVAWNMSENPPFSSMAGSTRRVSDRRPDRRPRCDAFGVLGMARHSRAYAGRRSRGRARRRGG